MLRVPAIAHILFEKDTVGSLTPSNSSWFNVVPREGNTLMPCPACKTQSLSGSGFEPRLVCIPLDYISRPNFMKTFNSIISHQEYSAGLLMRILDRQLRRLLVQRLKTSRRQQCSGFGVSASGSLVNFSRTAISLVNCGQKNPAGLLTTFKVGVICLPHVI